MVRALSEVMAPRGLPYEFRTGYVHGHSVAAKAVPGVKDALSMTIPAGSGRHRRQVYVELEQGAEFEQIREQIMLDPYFNKDETLCIR